MKDKIIVYHGSPHIVERPVFGAGNPYNDYGLGFYCTESIDLAKEWACSLDTDGYANQYILDMNGLSVLSLTEGNYNILNWLCILLENRQFKVIGDIAKQEKEYIFEHFTVDYKKYDIIKGYRADDSYFSFFIHLAIIGDWVAWKPETAPHATVTNIIAHTGSSFGWDCISASTVNSGIV